jgi:alpha-tubulin suppressor-like RCC1 family protein
MQTNFRFIHFAALWAFTLQAFCLHAQTVTQIAAGQSHSLFLKSDGSLWSMGSDQYGQLGDGNSTYYKTNVPEKVVPTGVANIAAGGYFSLFVKSDGTLWGMGDDDANELGDATTHNNTYKTNLPEEIITNGPAVTSVTAVYDYSLFVRADSSLWAMGDNADGQFGNGNVKNDNSYPIQLAASGYAAVSGGYVSYTEHSLFLTSDGALSASGDNEDGELGLGNYNNTTTQQPVFPSGVTAISAGAEFSFFITTGGALWAMGRNDDGQLGNGTFTNVDTPELIVSNGVASVSAGGYHTLFVKTDGSLWAMGDNASGQLGDGTYNTTNLPEMIVSNGVVAAAAGEVHSLFIKTDGSLWAMGDDTYGQLGNNSFNGTNKPIQIVPGSNSPAGFDQIAPPVITNGIAQLSFIGLAGTNYVLDRAYSLTPPIWTPQATNIAGTGGSVIFTNRPNAATNNFWRIRALP